MQPNKEIEKYLDSMKHFCPDITDAHLISFSKSLFVKEFNPKELVFNFNEIHEHVIFVTKGLIRSFYISENGDDITNFFISENEFITDYPALIAQKPSKYAFEILEPTIGVFLPKTAIDTAYEEYASLQKYGRRIAENILTMQQERIESFLFKSAKQRYLRVLEYHPDLINRVPQRHLASYIGIERQSLTRIRKQLLLNNRD